MSHRTFPSFSQGLLTATGPIDYGLTNDIVLHCVAQNSKLALKGLVCALTGLSPSEVREVLLLNPIDFRKYKGKEIILDLKVLLNNWKIINIELQIQLKYETIWWINRSLLYLCRTYDNIASSENYTRIHPALHVSIIPFELFPDEKKEFYARYRMQNIRTGKLYTGNFGLNLLYLNHIDYATAGDIQSGRKRWARAFLATTWEELRSNKGGGRDHVSGQCKR